MANQEPGRAPHLGGSGPNRSILELKGTEAETKAEAPPVDPEEKWGGDAGEPRKLSSKWRWIIRACLVTLVAAGIWMGVEATRTGSRQSSPGKADEERRIQAQVASAEEVAGAFLAESDPRRRLAWARDPELAEAHFSAYPKQALSAEPTDIRMMGHSSVEGRSMTGFAVQFANGTPRMLNVVETESGWRVDWDSFARYCSAGWEDLLSGKVESADVRVFVSPGDYHNVPFEDKARWTSFRLMSPDLPHDTFAYARVGSEREKRLKAIIMRTARFRQHMTLRITGREGVRGERLFEIVRVLAVGWVRGERDAEEAWE